MELKFRVWDNKRKMFVPNNFVIFSFHNGFKITIRYTLKHEFDKFNMTEYTLEDLEKKRITGLCN